MLVIPAVMTFEYAERRIRLSAFLRLLASKQGDRIEIAGLLDGLGERSFGAAMLLLALPNMVPLPPGASTVFGLPLILIATQMAIGRRTIWLPGFIRRRSIGMSSFARMVYLTRPHLRRAERLLHPRLEFMLSRVAARLTGCICVVLAILIALPIPLANFLSGLSVAAFALGLLRRDGIAVLVGWIVACISLAATVLISGAMWLAVKKGVELLLRAMTA
jgi:hypothetical protein